MLKWINSALQKIGLKLKAEKPEQIQNPPLPMVIEKQTGHKPVFGNQDGLVGSSVKKAVYKTNSGNIRVAKVVAVKGEIAILRPRNGHEIHRRAVQMQPVVA